MRIQRSLHNVNAEISASGLLVLAFALYICPFDYIVALMGAALVHELGHGATIWLLDMRIIALRFGAGGPCIVYSDPANSWAELLCALSGPATGIVFAFAMSALSALLGSAVCALSAGISLALSLFNLLPALPLDGGRALLAAMTLIAEEGAARSVSLFISAFVLALLLCLGMHLAVKGAGIALLCVWIWLFRAYIGELGIVKSGEMI